MNINLSLQKLCCFKHKHRNSILNNFRKTDLPKKSDKQVGYYSLKTEKPNANI